MIDRLLGGISLDVFFSEYFERQPLLAEFQPRDLFSISHVDQIVATSHLKYPFFRMFRDGDQIPIEQLTSSRLIAGTNEADAAIPEQLYREYSNRATLILQAMQYHDAGMARLCRELEVNFGFPVQANAYLTPPLSSGLPPHFDTHDVIILQIQGVKHWRIWGSPRSLPMRLQQENYDPAWVERYSKDTAPLIDVMLEAGQSIYIPRGFVHHTATDDQSSLHLTIGLMTTRVVDVIGLELNRLLSKVSQSNSMRKSLPLSWRSPSRLEEAAHSVEAAVRELVAAIDADQARSTAIEQALYSHLPERASRLDALQEFDTRKTYRINQDCPMIVTPLDKSLKVTFPGSRINLPLQYGRALDVMSGRATVSLTELLEAGLEEPEGAELLSQFVAVGRLVEHRH